MARRVYYSIYESIADSFLTYFKFLSFDEKNELNDMNS